MSDIPKVNGSRNWLTKGLLQVVLILALAAYGAVMTLTKNSGENIVLEKRLATLETCMNSMMSLPTDMAGIKVSIANLKESVDEIKKTLNNRR
jgi:uncharacterized protein YggE